MQDVIVTRIGVAPLTASLTNLVITNFFRDVGGVGWKGRSRTQVGMFGALVATHSTQAFS
jgi:hypothetical protein